MENTAKETKLLELLDIAICYIEQIADKDSPTLEYLVEHFEALQEDA